MVMTKMPTEPALAEGAQAAGAHREGGLVGCQAPNALSSRRQLLCQVLVGGHWGLTLEGMMLCSPSLLRACVSATGCEGGRLQMRGDVSNCPASAEQQRHISEPVLH